MIFLDLDGVLTNFVDGCFDHHKLNKIEIYKIWKQGEFNFPLEHMGFSDKNIFWNSLDHLFWKNLEWMPDGKEIINLLEQYFLSDNISILSTPTLHPGSLTGKLEWITKHIPTYRRKYIFTPIKYFLAHRDAILIDDSDRNIDLFKKHGGQAILIPRRWNSLYKLENDKFDMVEYLNKKIERL